MCVCVYTIIHIAGSHSRVHIFMTFCVMLQLRIVKLHIINITNLIFIFSIIVIIIIAVFTALFIGERTATSFS